ncbi:GATA transcription factor 2 [Hibiscus syriacus]|uniref:GATA transcription factor n=1 Tax=Hibiscus syriacus TaxID=106335 RepID=A0A6A3A2V7_HIBSY|nr:GATA transcription factor 4-like [Hibiscus syriacus]KAE8697519.1 GATA transcription factor 2 [Hibiscus syriacus]
MDMYGLSTPEVFHIDDLLDLSNEELFSSASTSTNNDTFPPSETTFSYASSSSAAFHPSFSDKDFTHDLCLPSDDVAELEWLSQFVDDSFSDFPSNSLAGIINPRNDHSSFSSKAWNKRSRAPPTTSKTKREVQRQASPAAAETGVRRCTHCASEKTPQWRTGPLGPKTLCNACGVRYKSGRLVPEYRPAASPTFVLTKHSNSHRKVLELRRQKELSGQQQEHEHRHHRHQQHQRRQQHDFEVC